MHVQQPSMINRNANDTALSRSREKRGKSSQKIEVWVAPVTTAQQLVVMQQVILVHDAPVYWPGVGLQPKQSIVVESGSKLRKCAKHYACLGIVCDAAAKIVGVPFDERRDVEYRK